MKVFVAGSTGVVGRVLVPLLLDRGHEVVGLVRSAQKARVLVDFGAQPVVAAKNPRGETVYWVGPAGAAREAGPGTDFNALERGAVSITPLQVDLTHAGQISLVADWIARK